MLPKELATRPPRFLKVKLAKESRFFFAACGSKRLEFRARLLLLRKPPRTWPTTLPTWLRVKAPRFPPCVWLVLPVSLLSVTDWVPCPVGRSVCACLLVGPGVPELNRS